MTIVRCGSVMMLHSSLRNCSGVNTIGSSSRNVPPVICTRSIGLRCVSNISHSMAYSNTCRMTLLMWDLVFCARGRVKNQRSTASGLTAPRSREPHFGRTCFVRLLWYPPPVVNLFGIRSAIYFWAASPNFATDAVGLVLLLAATSRRWPRNRAVTANRREYDSLAVVSRSQVRCERRDFRIHRVPQAVERQGHRLRAHRLGPSGFER